MKSRERVGTVLHLSSSSGNLILKAEGSVKIGESVHDIHGMRIGTVFDLFGSVSSPFVAVKPRTENPEGLLGKALFRERQKR